MAVTVLLARHGSHGEIGHVLSGRSDIALSDTGRAEAARLAARLAGVTLGAVHSSPRRRATETAAAVAEGRDLDVLCVDALDEIDFGGWSGRSFAALEDEAEWLRWNAARGSAAIPGGETMIAASRRAVRHIDELGPDGATILCVSHCDVIRGVVAHYLGLALDRILSFDIDPGSLSALAIWPGGGRVASLKERPL